MKIIKASIRKILHRNACINRVCKAVSRIKLNVNYKKMNRKEIFTQIYKSNMWGGDGYYSGSGSHDNKYVLPYCEMINAFIRENNIKTVMDLGCGDFNIGAKIASSEINYIGVDIFEDLIQSNILQYGSEIISFVCKDIVSDELPEADLCLIRQVLQHLDNKAVSDVLEKVKKYRFVIITECRTEKDDAVGFNWDIPSGANTRRTLQSGLYFEEKPFNCPNKVLLKLPYATDDSYKSEMVSCLLMH